MAIRPSLNFFASTPISDWTPCTTQIEWAKNNEEKCKEIAINAFNYAKQNFTYDKILENVYQVYENITCANILKLEENFINTYGGKNIKKIIVKNINVKQKK